MSDAQTASDALERACGLVGRFLYHFARVEQKIDQAIIKLLELDESVAPVVTGSIDFVRKLSMVCASARIQVTTTEPQKLVETVWREVNAVNDDRQTVAHCAFHLTRDGSVEFTRVVTRGGRVQSGTPQWDIQKFEQRYQKMSELEKKLEQLVEMIKPRLVPMDWYVSDATQVSRNPQMSAALAASSGATEVILPTSKD